MRLERVRRKLADLAARDDGSFHQGELSYDAEPPLTEAELAAIEADLGFQFPTELRAFLHEVHGGGPGLLPVRAYEGFAIATAPGGDFPLLEADTGAGGVDAAEVRDDDGDLLGVWPLDDQTVDVVVTTGPLAGAVFRVEDGRCVALRRADGARQTFLDWYEAWLDLGLSQVPR